MWYIIIGVVCFIVGVMIGQSALEHSLKKDGYIITTDTKRKIGEGKYNVINIRKRNTLADVMNVTDKKRHK